MKKHQPIIKMEDYDTMETKSLKDIEIQNVCTFIRHAIENQNTVKISVQRRLIKISPNEMKRIKFFGDDILVELNNNKMILFNINHISMIEVFPR